MWFNVTFSKLCLNTTSGQIKVSGDFITCGAYFRNQTIEISRVFLPFLFQFFFCFHIWFQNLGIYKFLISILDWIGNLNLEKRLDSTVKRITGKRGCKWKLDWYFDVRFVGGGVKEIYIGIFLFSIRLISFKFGIKIEFAYLFKKKFISIIKNGWFIFHLLRRVDVIAIDVFGNVFDMDHNIAI